MVGVSDIEDRDSLKAWLDARPAGARRDDAVWIAHRAASRVWPVFGRAKLKRSPHAAARFGFAFWRAQLKRSPRNDLTMVSVLRGCLISGVAAARPTSENKATAADAAHAYADVHAGPLAAGAAAVAAKAAATAAEAFAAKAAATAAEAAATAALVDADFWEAVRADCRCLGAGDPLAGRSLWHSHDGPSASHWLSVRQDLSRRKENWAFWIRWYDALLDPSRHPQHPDALLDRIALQENGFWNGTDAEVNARIAEIVAEFGEPVASPLANAAVTDFTFDTFYEWMCAVGFPQDTVHLRGDSLSDFLDDIGEAQDGLTDFADYAADARGPTNAPAVLERAAVKLLDELRRTKETEHIRARRVVTLAKHLEGFAQEETKRDEIGGTLASMLDDNLKMLGEVCRKHFAPSIAVLGALDGLDLGETAPEEVIQRLKKAVARIESGDDSLIPLRPDDLAMLKDMIRDLEVVKASIGEARTQDFEELQKGKLARGAGEVAATVGRYVDKVAEHSDKAGKTFDSTVKWYRRWQTFSDVMDWLLSFGQNGPPPGS